VHYIVHDYSSRQVAGVGLMEERNIRQRSFHRAAIDFRLAAGNIFCSPRSRLRKANGMIKILSLARLCIYPKEPTGRSMFVSTSDLEAFTGLKRPGAQARFLDKLGICYVRRQDGSIALRQAELDAHTLSRPSLAPRSAQNREPRVLVAGVDYPLSPGQRRWQARLERLGRKDRK